MGKTSRLISQLLDRSIQTAWNYKSLWLLGVFAGFGMNFNLETSGQSGATATMEGLGGVTTTIPAPSVWTFVYAIGLFILLNTIAIPSLVSAVRNIDRQGKFRFGASLADGIDVFFSVLALTLAGVILLVGSMVVLGGITGALFGIAKPLGWSSLVVVIPVGVTILFFYSMMINLSIRDIVIRRASLLGALQTTWRLIMSKLKATIALFLISLCIVGASFIALRFCFYLVRLIIALVTGNPTGELSTLPGLVFGLPFTLIVGGFFGACAESLFTYYYLATEQPSRDDIWATTGIRNRYTD